MGFSFNTLRNRREQHLAAHITQQDAEVDHEKSRFAAEHTGSSSDSDTLSMEERNEKEVQLHPDTVTAGAQLGQQKAEAAALVWSKKAVYATYAWVWLCFFMLAFQQAILNQATQAAYSSFQTAPAVFTANILSVVIAGVLKLPIAKILVIWGRAEGFVIFFGVYLLGMIILASCSGPNGYAAGYVLYWIGYDALYLIMDIFVADSSGLRNRAFCWAFVSTPFIITAFTAPLAVNSLFPTARISNWRWGIGLFCIVQPVVFLPLAIVFKFYQKKAEKLGLFKRESSGRTAIQSTMHYFYEFDIIGALILMTAFILFLLPFSLVTYQRLPGYKSAGFIAMVVIGILLFPVFALWERFGARVHFVEWELFKKRTVLGACALAALLNFSFYCWDSQYYNFVLVVYNLSVGYGGYMSQIYNVGSTFFGVMFGIWVRYSKHFKYEALCFGLPIILLGSGLVIHFRGGDGEIGYVVMTQIFIACGGGILVISESMAVMAAADRAGVPMALSLVSLFSSVGAAIGSAVAAAIYGEVFPKSLAERLPAAEQSLVTTIYAGGYATQVGYLPGTVERDAINFAYGQVQKWGGVASTVILLAAFPAIAIWKNYNVDKKQNKGTVI